MEAPHTRNLHAATPAATQLSRPLPPAVVTLCGIRAAALTEIGCVHRSARVLLSPATGRASNTAQCSSESSSSAVQAG